MVEGSACGMLGFIQEEGTLKANLLLLKKKSQEKVINGYEMRGQDRKLDASEHILVLF